ncbi:UNVERIFIED_CONTAM: hypothetical protein PYX00_002317 [Menopon gallinae]|uniref:Bystin n=1 Tax=Menopon gallinae TaxID=328185 RepID=A0AAW2IGI8_9NEOP
MGKAKKIKIAKKNRHTALGDELEGEKYAKPSSRVKIRSRRDEDDAFVDAELSKKILEQARLQQNELQEEEEEGISPDLKSKTISLNEDFASDNSEPESDEEFQGDYMGDIVVAEDDEKALEKFMNMNPEPRRTLADIIMEKITEKQTEIRTQFSDNESIKHMPEIDPRIKTMYKGVRDVLSKYRSGKLPKAFKIIPHLKNWEEILYITEPDKWSGSSNVPSH